MLFQFVKKLPSFFITTHDTFNIADPSSTMYVGCVSHMNLVNDHESPCSLVVRASDRCAQGHGFNVLPHAEITEITSFSFHLPSLKLTIFLYYHIIKDVHQT